MLTKRKQSLSQKVLLLLSELFQLKVAKVEKGPVGETKKIFKKMHRAKKPTERHSATF